MIYDEILQGGYNENGVIIALVCWLIVFLQSSPSITFNSPLRNDCKKNLFWGSLFFYCVCILGLHRPDTYHVEDLTLKIYDHLEPLHEWLFVSVSNNQLFTYRIFVFGGATGILFYVAKRLNLYNHNFLLVCALFLLDSMFCEMRGTIGHSVLLLGYVLILENSQKVSARIINAIIGLLLICLSFYLHRSIFICIVFAILSLLDFSKKRLIIISWILFPILVSLIELYFSKFILMIGDFDYGDMGISDTIYTYGESDFTFGKYSIIGNIVRFLCNCSKYIVLGYLTFSICFNKLPVENLYKYLFRWYYICMYVGLLLSFTEIGDWLSYRILVMAIYPMPFILVRLWKVEFKTSIWTKMILISGVVGNVVSLVMRYMEWS